MKTVNKIIFLGVTLVVLSSICGTFSCLTDTYSYFDDTKEVDVNLTTSGFDSNAILIEPSDYKLPANEIPNGTAFTTGKNPEGSEADISSVDESSSNPASSANHSGNNFSVAGNNTLNSTINNSTSAPLPISNFSSNITSGYAPLSVQFIDMSINATKWSWDFGDANNSTQQNPVHTYSQAGNYTVNLTISNENGTDSKLSSISVLEKPFVALLPVANFSNIVSRGFVPFSIKFTDLSENATVWNWDFGDGNTSTEQNPVHTYHVPGNYTVMLIASNENGTNSTCCTITALQTIQPVVNASSSVPSSHVLPPAQFNNSTGQAPAHAYSTAGNYTDKPVATGAARQNTKTREISEKKKSCDKRDSREQKTH